MCYCVVLYKKYFRVEIFSCQIEMKLWPLIVAPLLVYSVNKLWLLNVPLGDTVFSPFHLNWHSVCASVTSCTFPDKWGSLWVWERRELIRGLRSVVLLLWYTLMNRHGLQSSEGLLKHLRQSSTGFLFLSWLFTFQTACSFRWIVTDRMGESDN